MNFIMVTNQMMTVQIGSFGNLEIGHKNMMGKVSQVVEMGNISRETRGLRSMTLDEVLSKQEFWEFVLERNVLFIEFHDKSRESQDYKNSSLVTANYEQLREFIAPSGMIRYSELIKEFPNLIYSKRGKNGGTWAELYILLKIASMLDKALEVRIYKTFIEDKILFFRDLGGDNFKEFNAMIDTLPDRIGQNIS
jgi:hypothetical protein